jgi:serine/threonine protein phosphatase 1
MRILAIGDIHGCSIAFDTLLAAVQLQPDDQIITLGDYVDHGPDSKGIIDRLIVLHDTGRLVALLGNHERAMLEASLSENKELYWICCDGDKTLASYSAADGELSLANVPNTHWSFLENICVNWYETDTHFFVHGNVDPNLPLSKQSEEVLFWERFKNPTPHCSGKIMVCGHTSQKSGVPLNLGHAICIDTWVYGKGWLTCLDVISGRVWQANQAGEHREAWIDQFTKSEMKG